MHTNSAIPSHAFYLAVEGGRNRVSGLTVQGVGAANREQIERVLLPRVRLPASRVGDFLHGARRDDSGGPGSVRGKQRGGAGRHASVDGGRRQLRRAFMRSSALTLAFRLLCLVRVSRSAGTAGARPAPRCRSACSCRSVVLFQVDSNDFGDSATIRRERRERTARDRVRREAGPAFDVSGACAGVAQPGCRSRG